MNGFFNVYGWTAMPAVADRDPEAAYFIRTANGFKLQMVANTAGKEIVELDLTAKEDVANKVTNANNLIGNLSATQYPSTQTLWNTALVFKGQLATGADLGAYTEAGSYWVPNAIPVTLIGIPPNYPSGGGATLIVLSPSNLASAITQILIPSNTSYANANGNPTFWIRQKVFSTQAWSDWQTMTSREWVASQGFLTAETDPVYTAQEPAIIRNRGNIAAGSDLNTYYAPGVWECTSANSSTILNIPAGSPPSGAPFILIVYGTSQATGGYTTQLLSSATSGPGASKYRWARSCDSAGAWSPWGKIIAADDNVSLLNNDAGYLTSETEPIFNADKGNFLRLDDGTNTGIKNVGAIDVNSISNSSIVHISGTGSTNTPFTSSSGGDIFTRVFRNDNKYVTQFAQEYIGSMPKAYIRNSLSSGGSQIWGNWKELLGAGDNISRFNNDLGYITSSSIPAAQTLSLSGQNLSLSGGGGTVTLPAISNASVSFTVNSLQLGAFTLNQASNGTIDLSYITTHIDYNNLLNKPTLGNGTLTIKLNGATAGTFSANQASDNTIDLGNVEEIKDDGYGYAATTDTYAGFDTQGGLIAKSATVAFNSTYVEIPDSVLTFIVVAGGNPAGGDIKIVAADEIPDRIIRILNTSGATGTFTNAPILSLSSGSVASIHSGQYIVIQSIDPGNGSRIWQQIGGNY